MHARTRCPLPTWLRRRAFLLALPARPRDTTGKCLCSEGNFSPCMPTDTVCSWGDQPICAGSTEFFGIDACKFVGALQKHLPKVQCPY